MRRFCVVAALVWGMAQWADGQVLWSQPPVVVGGTNFTGWGESSIRASNPIVADAWINVGTQPVGRITWWGAFAGWRAATPPPDAPTAFHFVMWQDAAGQPPGFPQPGAAAWVQQATSISATYVGQTADPRGAAAATASVFRFVADLPPGERFEPGSFPPAFNWWLTVSASPTAAAPDHPFGWLTRAAAPGSPATAGAVRVTSPLAPNPPDAFVSGAPVQFPSGTPWNVAFVLEGPQFDFGDAPDSYQTTVGVDGARHAGPSSLYLGAAWDSEPDGLPTAALNGDDLAGSDDEDGIQISGPLVIGSTNLVPVTASAPGLLSAWVDFDRDGSWNGSLGQIWFDVAVTAGVNFVTLVVPDLTSSGSAAARFRLSSQPGLTASGPAPDGEVEDHQLSIGNAPLDYGDAPSPYPVLLAQNGARHAPNSGLHLGAALDGEADGQPSAQADGDDLQGAPDDEDGVELPATWLLGTSGSFPVVASSNGLLNAWLDFNRDGDWADAGEQIATNLPMVPGTNALALAVPLSAQAGLTFARFRLCSASGVGVTGSATDGEVEDYSLRLVALDYGDAPDVYQTTLGASGPSHVGPSALYLGATWDAELDGQPSAALDGDDLSGSDDEDGVSVASPLFVGAPGLLQVTASASGWLNAWVDYDHDGSWGGPLDQVGNNVAVTAGVNLVVLNVPAFAPTGSTAARFRLSSQPGLTPSGPAPDGEVEDHRLTVSAYDFGDAPGPFPTVLNDDGARHVGPSPLYLGVAWDAEPDGQPSAMLDGDDGSGVDDEDGISIAGPLIAGATGLVQVTSSTSGWLNAWVDLNHDGNWGGPEEQVWINVAVTAGVNLVGMTIPAGSSNGTAAARFRLSSQAGLTVTGSAPDGEVEDHRLTLAGAAMDYGDAPAPYPVTLAQDGARHPLSSALRLGVAADSELDGQPSANAQADDAAGVPDDEDGVTLPASWLRDTSTSIGVFASTNGLLNAWVDFNQDGDWSDAGEQIATNEPMAMNLNLLPAHMPHAAVVGPTFARFRISSVAGLTPVGPAVDGEVEDYQLIVTQEAGPPPVITGLQRTNGSFRVGVQESGDSYYQLEGSTNLLSGTGWRVKTPLTRSPVTILVDTNPAVRAEAYRVVAPFVQ